QLAGELALQAQAWSACLRHGQSLGAIQPDAIDAIIWQATALDHLNKSFEAQKACQDLIARLPHEGIGYQLLVASLERSKNYAAALQWAKRWRQQVPEDTGALRALARLHALTGQQASAAMQDELRKWDTRHEFEGTLAIAQGFAEGHAHHQAAYYARQALMLA